MGRRGVLSTMAVLLLAAGPILLYRFALLVSLQLLLAWLAWRTERSLLAGVLMAVAILTKLYPLMLVPLFFLSPRRGAPRRPWRFLAGLCRGDGRNFLYLQLPRPPVWPFLQGFMGFHEHKPGGSREYPWPPWPCWSSKWSDRGLQRR